MNVPLSEMARTSDGATPTHRAVDADGVTPPRESNLSMPANGGQGSRAGIVGLVSRRAKSAPARGNRQGPLLRLRGDIPQSLVWMLTAAGVAALVGLWVMASTIWTSDGFQVPTIAATWDALVEMARSGELWQDFRASSLRVFWGYSISLVIGVGLGVLIGSFRSVDAFLEPQLGFLRYIPATALTPLLLIWLGIEEAPKIALIVVGTVFYNLLMVADVARAVPNELVKSAYTLGAGRLTVLRRVILPHSWPGIVDVARINLAAAWLMLVVAELLAAEEGLAFRIVRAQRFRRIDRMFALLLVLGLLGLMSDMALRWLRNRSARWAKD